MTTTSTTTAISHLAETYGDRIVQRAQEALEAADPTGIYCTPRLLDTLCQGLVQPGENLADTLTQYREGRTKHTKDELAVFDSAVMNLFGF